ncbi:MAG: calcium/sodium antiporter [Betaproteobacteria bacterium]
MSLVFFVLGLITLVAGASLMVRGAAKLAVSFGISPLVVGLTVVAFGTSAPEVAVSVGAVLQGKGDIAVGNVVGSNIFNVLFILGASALIAPLLIHRQLVRQEVPIMIGASVILCVMALDGRIGRFDAALLAALFAAYTVFLVVQARRGGNEPDDASLAELPAASRWDRHWSVQVLLVVAGLALLVVGANWLVDAAVDFARKLGVSDLVIGLTIVAAGTSLPEVATSIVATLRGERDIAVGNVVGSCTFNIFACLGISGLVAPGGLAVPAPLLSLDLWVMLAAAVACFPIFVTGREIARWEGVLFLAHYVAYTMFLILAATHHAALQGFSDLLLAYVLPLTVIVLVVSLLHSNARPR